MAWDDAITNETTPSTGVGTALNAAWYAALVAGVKALFFTQANAAAGKRTIWLSGEGGHLPTTTPAGAVTAFTETTTNDVNFKGTLYPTSAANQFKEWTMIMPSNWNGSTVTAIPVFTTASTDASNHTIIFSVQGTSFASTEANDTAFGTLQSSTYTCAASIANKITFGPETAAITVGGASPAGGELVQWRVGRTGSDTMTGDITLLGVKITYTTNAFSDS